MFKNKIISVISDSGVSQRKDIFGILVCIICTVLTIGLIFVGVLACLN